MSCDVWPWDTHQSSLCLHCVTVWSYWSEPITTGALLISAFSHLSVCIEICWQHILGAIRYADLIYAAHHDVESQVEPGCVSWVLTQPPLLEYWWIFFGWTPANKINVGIINLWIWQGVDRDVKKKIPVPIRWWLMADDWGGSAGFSLAFVVAVTSVLSDLVSWHGGRGLGNDNVDSRQKTLLPAVMYSRNSMLRWHRFKTALTKRWQMRGARLKRKEMSSERESSERFQLG